VLNVLPGKESLPAIFPKRDARKARLVKVLPPSPGGKRRPGVSSWRNLETARNRWEQLDNGCAQGNEPVGDIHAQREHSTTAMSHVHIGVIIHK
jgi:hypothetical protein